MSSRPPSSPTDRAGLLKAAAWMVCGAFCAALGVQTVLGDYALAGNFVSRPGWLALVQVLGGRIAEPGGGRMADVPFGTLFVLAMFVAAASWLAGAGLIAGRTSASYREALVHWGRSAFLWWLVPGLWTLLWYAAVLAGWETLQALFAATVQLWFAFALAGFTATSFARAFPPGGERDRLPAAQPDGGALESARIPRSLWLAMAVYVVVFTAMNWQLYRGLRLPHGDSAMYEEHLWNLEHGKGFRSYLDPGLFLGEHIQFVHVALVPLHLLWPSQMLLELCQSLALASAAIPIFRIARRHTGSDRAGLLLAVAYLLYFPMQFLDIAIDGKTFRPIAFGVPLMLLALDRMERRKYVSMALLLLAALTAKEDFAIVLAPLGLWLLLRGPAGVAGVGADRSPRRARWVGGALALFGVGYLLLVLLVLIPAFRSGHDPHYTGYFDWIHDLAASSGAAEDSQSGPLAIAWAMIMHPSAWLGRLFSLRSVYYALALLLPLGGLALFSPGRLAVMLPLFGVLCLMEVGGGAANEAQFPLIPFHHFHAPLIPILFWAAAAGLPRAGAVWEKFRPATDGDMSRPSGWPRQFVWTSAAACGLFFSLSPLGVPFWDAGSQWHWSRLYVPGERAARFPAVEQMIPPDARVASTDLVHPRFTHYERSYDYSQYPRAVNNNRPGAPPDTDYIVIDKQGRYSTITRVSQIREYREQPDHWIVLLDGEYYIVLKRKKPPAP